MQNYESVIGADGFLNVQDSSTWNITIKVERVSKELPPNNQLQNLKFVSDPRIGQYEQAAETEAAHAIKARLKDLHPWTEQRLGVKAEVLKEFDFRVLVGRDQPSEPGQRLSHISLSYTWWSEQWLQPGSGEGWGLSPALRANTARGNFEIPETKSPISNAMWNAFLAERETHAEGIWIDQLCIDQNNPAEIENALLLMGRIYKTARKVVVPLENVLLYSDEAQAMLEHARVINSIANDQREEWSSWTRSADLQVLGASAYALMKIEGSRWFRRIWCHHEMRMGDDFVFVAPIVERIPSNNHKDSTDVMKLDCKALITLITSCRTMITGTGLTHHEIMLQSFLKTAGGGVQKDGQPRSFIPATVLAPGFDKFTPERELRRKATGKHREDTPIMRTLRELMAYHTQHPKDVFHVLLDTIAPGLVFVSGTELLSAANIVFMTSVVALASGDLSPLLAPGDLRFWQSNKVASLPHSAYSWAALPQSAFIDWEGPLAKMVNGPSCKITDLGLRLPVLVVGSSLYIAQMEDIDAEFTLRYSKIIANVLSFQRDIAARDPTAVTDWTHLNKDPDGTKAARPIDPDYLRNYTEAMLLANSCGTDWMADRAAELSQLGLFPENVNLPAQQKEYESLRESDDSKLRVFDHGGDLQSEVGCKLSERWSGFRDYIAFFDALVAFLIGPEWEHKTKSIDADLRVSLVQNFSQDGTTWAQLLALPNKQQAGNYWLVRPSVTHMGARPDLAEINGIDLRLGGTWAVQAVAMRSVVNDEVHALDGEGAMSTDIWIDETAPGTENDIDRHMEQMVELKMVSRSVRLFPTGEWQRPRLGKMAVVHG